jgi:hypothetical protein
MIKKAIEIFMTESSVEKTVFKESHYHSRFFLISQINNKYLSKKEFMTLIKKDSEIMFEHINQILDFMNELQIIDKF